VLCLVTDRQRLAAAVNAGEPSGIFDALVQQVEAAAMAGVHLIQIRERDLDGRDLVDLTSRCVAAVRTTIARIVVNDRVDVAMAAGAHGVHLRESSFSAGRVRAIAPSRFLVGRSVHDVGGARAAARDGGIDYLVFGPVYATRSKPGTPEAGVDALRAVCAASTLPVLAIGGVTPSNVEPLMRAGAAGVAAIGMFAGRSEAVTGAVKALRDCGAGGSQR
jgi:thiamine-phosphate pyrophosphorylase